MRLHFGQLITDIDTGLYRLSGSFSHTHTQALQQLLLQVAGKTVRAPRAALLLAREASPPPSPRSRVLFNDAPSTDSDLGEI